MVHFTANHLVVAIFAIGGVWAGKAALHTPPSHASGGLAAAGAAWIYFCEGLRPARSRLCNRPAANQYCVDSRLTTRYTGMLSAASSTRERNVYDYNDNDNKHCWRGSISRFPWFDCDRDAAAIADSKRDRRRFGRRARQKAEQCAQCWYCTLGDCFRDHCRPAYHQHLPPVADCPQQRRAGGTRGLR